LKRWHWLAIALFVVAAILLSLWLLRAFLAARYARAYFRDHGVNAAVEISELGFSGVSGRVALGPANAPELSAERIELKFDPLRWKPVVVEVRLVHPLVRAHVNSDGKVTFGSVQGWIDALSRQKGKSEFVSDNLAVSLAGLRTFLTTPAGNLEVGGNVRLLRNVPVSTALRVQPAMLAWKGAKVALRNAYLNYEDGRADVHFAGDTAYTGQTVHSVDATLNVSGLHWSGSTISATTAHILAGALAAGPVSEPKIELTARNLRVTGSDISADLTVTAGGSMHTDLHFPRDAALTKAITANLSRLDLDLTAHVETRGKALQARFGTPLTVKGARGARLLLSALTMRGSPDSLNAAFQADLAGSGLPAIKASVANLVWTRDGVRANGGLNARFNYTVFHDAALSANGVLSWQSGRYAFSPKNCGHVRFTAFHPATSDLARNIEASICPAGGQPMVEGDGTRWKFSGAARDVSAFLPLANAQADQISGLLAFEGAGADIHGQVSRLAGQVSDKTAPARFKPLLEYGSVSLANGVWRGQFAVSRLNKEPLGEVTFQDAMATGLGSAHIAAPHLTFAPGKFSPEDLSVLLAALRKADGTANFQGDVSWTPNTFTSRGVLDIRNLDFLTPLGTAHSVKARIDFTSLLPPHTAENQEITISRVDWTLPFSGVDLRFSFDPALVKVNALSSGWAEGKASLDAFTINPAQPGRMSGAARFQSITLGSLIAASNLGNKFKLSGKISGRIPFTIGPDGLRIAGGHLASDGVGRLSVDRSLWMQGEAAISSNAVQDFAYQALENLAFDSMSADLNSLAGGRLQVVFHIKGRSDPPRPQTANVAIADILNGTALYKPVPLPSGTTINLTLDTSLNFDELLKSYAEAWSKSLSLDGHPDAAGAKP
jgi:hypothetical protein